MKWELNKREREIKIISENQSIDSRQLTGINCYFLLHFCNSDLKWNEIALPIERQKNRTGFVTVIIFNRFIIRLFDLMIWFASNEHLWHFDKWENQMNYVTEQQHKKPKRLTKWNDRKTRMPNQKTKNIGRKQEKKVVWFSHDKSKINV